MRKDFVTILIVLLSSLSYSQSIKLITEYKKVGDSLVTNRKTEFDASGNMIREVSFRGYDQVLKTDRNQIQTIDYLNGQKIQELSCEEFVARDTCVLRSYSIFEYDAKNRIEKQTKYEVDSLIRFIKETKQNPQIRTSKTYSWEFNPVAKPNIQTALILTDTIFYDSYHRITKQVRYNSQKEAPLIELYTYSDNSYTYKTIGSYRDTTMTYVLNKYQSMINQKTMEYVFKSDDQFQYEIEYH